MITLSLHLVRGYEWLRTCRDQQSHLLKLYRKSVSQLAPRFDQAVVETWPDSNPQLLQAYCTITSDFYSLHRFKNKTWQSHHLLRGRFFTGRVLKVWSTMQSFVKQAMTDMFVSLCIWNILYESKIFQINENKPMFVLGKLKLNLMSTFQF